MEKEHKDNSFMIKLATLIVDKRKGFYLVFILLIIFSLISMNKVKVNNDLTTYLSDDTETRQGMDLMDEQFTTYGTTRIMVCNVTYEEAKVLSEQIKEMEGVSMLDFDDSPDYYHDMEALFSVTFEGRQSRRSAKHILRQCWRRCRTMMSIIPPILDRRSGMRRIWIRIWWQFCCWQVW